jgi:phosphomevalonate kinase
MPGQPAAALVALAPGKLFLVGEYAVLDGAPAVVAAVDRGVLCEATPGGRALSIETPAGDDRFARPALEAAGAPAGRYRFLDWNPVGLPDKPGFGGSAAATVAAMVAGRAAAGRPPLVPGALSAAAIAVHFAVQGSGSGLDVAASALGGVHRLRPAPGGPPEAAPLPSPPLIAVYSGRSARTGPRVARYLGWRDRAEFVAASEALVAAFPADPIRAMREAYLLLKAMAARADVDYDTPALARIAELARGLGGAAKPSGAGGGDVAVAILPDPEATAAFAAACAAEGLPPIPLSVAPAAGVVEPGEIPAPTR